MRAKLLSLVAIAALAAPMALAQNAAPPDHIFANHGEIEGLIQKAMKDRKGNAPNTIEPILSLAPYRAQLDPVARAVRGEHGDEHVGDTAVPRRRGVGPAQAEQHVRALGARGPHLLPVDHQVVAFDTPRSLQ